MSIQVQCPGCGGRFQAADRLAGKRAKCPHCSAAISVPAAGSPETAQAASADRPSQPAPAGEASGAPGAAWYVQTSDGSQHGPMTQAQLERLVSSGRLDSFCRVRHQSWSKWKWAEDLFPQLVQFDAPAATGDDARQDAEVEPPTAAPSVQSGAPQPRVVTCPDCGSTVSTRASQCPHCGCPMESGAGPKPGILGSKWGLALVVSSVAVLLVIAVVGLGAAGLGLRWWLGKAPRLVSQEKHEAAVPPAELPAPAAPPAVSAEEMEAAMQEAAAEGAKRIDDQFRTAYSAKKLIDETKLSAELMQALAQGGLDAIPDALPAELAPQTSASYQSLYDSLYNECLAYLRENVSREEFTKQAVWDAARRWEDEKQALLEKQLTEELEKHLAPGRQPP